MKGLRRVAVAARSFSLQATFPVTGPSFPLLHTQGLLHTWALSDIWERQYKTARMHSEVPSPRFSIFSLGTFAKL